MNETLALDKIVTYAIGDRLAPPIAAGRRRRSCNVGAPAGGVVENPSDSTTFAEEFNSVTPAVYPAPIGPMFALLDPPAAIVSDVLVDVTGAELGAIVGVGVGVETGTPGGRPLLDPPPPPPPHAPTAAALKSTNTAVDCLANAASVNFPPQLTRFCPLGSWP